MRARVYVGPGLLLLASACARSPGSPPPQTRAATAFFEDTTSDVGLDFRHDNGARGEYLICEIMGAGAALFDADRDGDLDLYLVQGGGLGAGEGGASDRLYRNDLQLGDPASLRFTDISEESGIAAADGYGMGVATGDFDNDGWVDLYVTNYGGNRLWRNRGVGAEGAVTFTDVTVAAGVGDPEWSVAAAFFDYDRDGWLDLFIGNYVRFRRHRNVECTSATGTRDYCGPQTYRPQPDRLLRNRGDGSFEDRSGASGIAARESNSLGVVVGDFDGDGWPDLYVANDGLPNLLWLNLRDGTFREEAALAGLAVNARGRPEASMGIAVGDVDGDGDEDLFLTHLRGETNTLYLNRGSTQFEDGTAMSGLGGPSLGRTAFGARFFDLENDGDLDLLAVNGTIKVIEELVAAADPFPYHQADQLFVNLGDGSFVDRSQVASAAMDRSEVSRGAAFGDLDNDGDTDVVVSNNGGPARVLRNQVGQDRPWIGLDLRSSARPALGARAQVEWGEAAAGWRASRWVRTSDSYASAGDPRLLFGVPTGAGDPTVASRVVVVWPDGAEEEWRELALRRYHELSQGSGRSPGGGAEE